MRTEIDQRKFNNAKKKLFLFNSGREIIPQGFILEPFFNSLICVCVCVDNISLVDCAELVISWFHVGGVHF